MRAIYGLSGYVSEPMYGEIYAYTGSGKTITPAYRDWLDEVVSALESLRGKEMQEHFEDVE